MSYNKGDKVKWNWGKGSQTGEIETVYTEKTTRKIDGTEVTRKASKDEPAYYIKDNENNNHVLKSHSEVEKA